ncbi:MAG TPA: HlyD family efflux transporter periplasmic adaptor subunit [Candidatus Limnocylindrales bacterium]
MRYLRVLFVVLLLVVGVGAVLVAVGVLPPSSTVAGSQYITTAAARRDVTKSVVASGSVTASTVYDLRFGSASQPAGSTTSATASTSNNSSSPTWPVTSVAVKVGDVVAAGDVLAVADPTNAKLQLVIAQANLAAAKSKLTADKSAPTSDTKASARDALRQAQLQLSQARQNSANTRTQNWISLTQARRAVTTANSKLAADKKAHAPSQQISADKASVSQAQDNVTSTIARVNASNDQAANQVASAQLGLTSAQHNYTTRLAPSTAAQIASDQASVATAQSSVDTAQLAIDNASLKAPIAGRVSTVNIVAGATAPSGTAIEVQSSAMTVTAAFAESDVPNLKVGQAADITIKAVGTDAVAGTVSSIAESSASSSGGVVSYNVTAAIATPPATLRVGMSAQVSVTIAQSANVIAVPAAAVAGSGGTYVVQVVDSSGQVQDVTVDVGLVTSSYIEITSGLAEGQRVVIGTSTSRTGTSTSTGGGLFGGGAIPGGGRFNGGGRNPGGGTTP